MMFEILTGHALLRDFLRSSKLLDDYSCKKREKVKEPVYLMLCECEALAGRR
jgi:hypothetical protein